MYRVERVQSKNKACVHLHDSGKDNNHHFWIKKTLPLGLEKTDLRKNDQGVGAAWDDWEGKWWGWSSSLNGAHCSKIKVYPKIFFFQSKNGFLTAIT